VERKPLHALRPRPEGRGHFPFLRSGADELLSGDSHRALDDDELDAVAGGGAPPAAERCC
jgi:hypothetical protein